MMCFHVLEFYVMLLICYCTILLHWWGLLLLSISLFFSDLCAYAFVILIWIILLGYIIMLSFIMIPVDTTTMNTFDLEYPFGDFLEDYKIYELSEFLQSHC